MTIGSAILFCIGMFIGLGSMMCFKEEDMVSGIILFFISFGFFIGAFAPQPMVKVVNSAQPTTIVIINGVEYVPKH